MSKVTMKDIADALGISVSTVNRALIGKGRISQETQQRVLDTAREMGYTPNMFGKSLSLKDEIVIAVISPADVFFKEVMSGIESFLKEMSQFKLRILYKHFDMYDITRQAEQIDECLEQNVDGLLISAAHPVLLNPSLQRLIDAGSIVLTFINDAPESGRLCFVGQNGKTAGCIAAELFEMALPQNARIALMASNTSALGVKDRANCFLETLVNSNRKFQLLGPFEYYDTSYSAYQIAEMIIRTQSVDAVYVTNMEGTLALGKVLSQFDTDKKIFAVGHDLNEQIEGYIQNSFLNATLFQDPFSQGYYAVKLLFEYLYMKRAILEDTYYMRTIILLKANLHEKPALQHPQSTNNIYRRSTIHANSEA